MGHKRNLEPLLLLLRPSHLKMVCVIFLLLMIYSVRCQLPNSSQPTFPEVEDRIHEGYNVDIGKYPHATFLLFDYMMPKSCGGSLIWSRAVLTAAHCVDELRLKSGKITAFFGASTPKDSKVVRDVKDYVIHPKYNDYNGKNNLAVVFLNKKVPEQSNIKTIPLAESDPPIGQNLYSAGWGKQKFERPPKLPDLSNWRSIKSTKQEVIDRRECAEYTGFKVSGSALCTKPVKGYFFNDDAGDGLVWKKSGKILVGVLSYVTDDGASFCTSVANAKDWIKKTYNKLKDRNTLKSAKTYSRQHYCQLGAAQIQN